MKKLIGLLVVMFIINMSEAFAQTAPSDECIKNLINATLSDITIYGHTPYANVKTTLVSAAGEQWRYSYTAKDSQTNVTYCGKIIATLKKDSITVCEIPSYDDRHNADLGLTSAFFLNNSKGVTIYSTMTYTNDEGTYIQEKC